MERTWDPPPSLAALASPHCCPITPRDDDDEEDNVEVEALRCGPTFSAVVTVDVEEAEEAEEAGAEPESCSGGRTSVMSS